MGFFMQVFRSLQQQMADSPLRHRWQQLLPRERLALSVLFLFLVLMVLYQLLWQPAWRELREASSYYQQQHELHAYLLQHAGRARKLEAQPNVSLPGEQLQGLVTSTAQRHGLRIERLDRDVAALQVALAQAAFESLVGWLDELQAMGIELLEVSLRRTSSGQVEARLSLAIRM